MEDSSAVVEDRGQPGDAGRYSAGPAGSIHVTCAR